MSGAGFQAGLALTRPCESLEQIRESARQLMRANEANPDPSTSANIAPKMNPRDSIPMTFVTPTSL